METLKNPLVDFISSVLSLYGGLYVHFWRNYEGRQVGKCKNENCCSDHNLQKPGPWLILTLQGTKRSNFIQFE